MPLKLIEQKEAYQSSKRNNPWTVTREPRACAADDALEFDRFQVLLRRRELLADGVPVKLGTRAFDLLLVLLEADGALVTKNELLCRVWPDVVVSEANLKFQICALRSALGENRDLIRTECGRGYRFTGTICSTGSWGARCRSIRQRQRRPAVRRLLLKIPLGRRIA